jgi:hypothetical protein
MPLNDYSVAELTPRLLTKEEMENPYRVLADLFSYGHLPQLREQFRQWHEFTVCGSFHKYSVSERRNWLRFYNEMEKLVEAAWTIHKIRNPDRYSG